MRKFFRIILAPVEVVCSVVSTVYKFLYGFLAGLLSAAATVIAVLAVLLLLFSQITTQVFWKMLLTAFLVSPIGIPGALMLVAMGLNALSILIHAI